MTDVKLINGDVMRDSSGRYVMLEGADALFQRALNCVSAVRKGFIYDRALGCDPLEGGLTSPMQAQLLINEALCDYDNTYARVLSVGESVRLRLSINGESRTQEVLPHGQL